jgi:hypothetical protein
MHLILERVTTSDSHAGIYVGVFDEMSRRGWRERERNVTVYLTGAANQFLNIYHGGVEWRGGSINDYPPTKIISAQLLMTDSVDT